MVAELRRAVKWAVAEARVMVFYYYYFFVPVSDAGNESSFPSCSLSASAESAGSTCASSSAFFVVSLFLSQEHPANVIIEIIIQVRILFSIFCAIVAIAMPG